MVDEESVLPGDIVEVIAGIHTGRRVVIYHTDHEDNDGLVSVLDPQQIYRGCIPYAPPEARLFIPIVAVRKVRLSDGENQIRALIRGHLCCLDRLGWYCYADTFKRCEEHDRAILELATVLFGFVN